jgi:hypothetical protein
MMDYGGHTYRTYQAANLVWVAEDQKSNMAEIHSSAALKQRFVAIVSADRFCDGEMGDLGVDSNAS